MMYSMIYIELKNGITGKMDISKPLMLAPDAKYEKGGIDLDKICEFSMNLAAKSSANTELDTTNALINAAYALEKSKRRNAAENDSDKKEETKKPCSENI